MDSGNSVNSDGEANESPGIVITDVRSIQTTSKISPSKKISGKTNPVEIRKITMPKSSSIMNLETDASFRKSNKSNIDENFKIRNTKEIKEVPNMNISISKVSNTGKDKFVALKIKNLNDLKKATSHIKLPTMLSKPAEKKIEKEINEGIKTKLKKYCRTCAGLKVPLIDIFSERGNQMRLQQQIQHLEVIDKNNSLSTQMCMDCICDMKMSYKFFMQIQKAELRLKAIYSTLNEVASKSISNETEIIRIVGTSDTGIVKKQTSEQKVIDLIFSKEQKSGLKVKDVTSLQEPTTKIYDKDTFHNDDSNLGLLDDDHFVDIEPYSRDVSMEEFDPGSMSDILDDSTDNSGVNFSNTITKHVEEVVCEKKEKKQDKDETIKENKLKNSSNVPEKHSKNNVSATVKENIVKCKNNVLTNDKKLEVSAAVKEGKAKSNDSAQKNNENTKVPSTVEQNKTKCSDTAQKNDLKSNLSATVKEGKAKLKDSDQEKDEKIKISMCQSKKKVNSLKRKLSNSNLTSDEDTETSKKISSQVSTGLKDIRIPKLDLEDPLSVRVEKDGVMYVTAKGSKPNEMLLIKVKKVDKKMDKAKKKLDSSFFRMDDKKDIAKDSIIDRQIEEYKKKRVRILGESATHPETSEIEPEIRSVSEMEIVKEEPIEEFTDTRREHKRISFNLGSLSSFMPNSASYLQKLIDRKKESEKKENSEQTDEHARLKSILKQKDEYIQDFIKHLKQRKIVASRLKDDDIITLYEMKNNVVIERPSKDIVVESLELDDLEITDIYECDFCFKSFLDPEMEFEHAKVHDFKLMHYCEDCNKEFNTHKAKRAHNSTCIQKLMCKYCEILLDSKGKKRQHEQKHIDDQYGQLCDICGEKFKHMGTLDQHVKVKHMDLEKIFKCPQCPKRFAFRTKLTFHLKSVHTNLRAFLCEDCGADFKNPASLRHHRIRKHQKGNNKKECNICQKMIPIYGMSKHMHTHRAYTIKCSSCDKMFKNTSTLKQHERIHENKRQYTCDKCGVGFNRRDGLRLHLKVHEKPDSKGLKECSCALCGEKFPNHSTLVIHRNRVHSDGRNYTCNICNRSMISSRSLEWHMAHIHDVIMPESEREESSLDKETKRVTCKHCDKTFKTEMILRTHVKNAHTEKEPLKCLDCDETFTSEVRLKHHMMISHERTEGTATCPHCPKRFVNGLRLKTHMISHSDERPFTCDICGFMLKTKVQLVKHKQNKHSDERPLQCRYCSWKCKQVSALVCHERTHTNERPYSCSVCKQKFKYLGDKNKHERRHESLGGSGFKRIVTGRNTTPKNLSRTKEAPGDVDSDRLDEEPNEEGIEVFDESQLVKFESEMVAEESGESYEQVYIGSHISEEDMQEEATHIVIGMEEDTSVYTEEVTADPEETEIISDGMIDPQMLQPGTVVHLQQQDETGKIQVIPVMLSLSDLADGSSDVSLTTASIMYSDE